MMARTPRHVLLAQKVNVFKRILDTEDGKALLAELKRFCKLEETTMMVSPNTKQVDPYATLYNEGKRQVLLHMLKLAGLTYHDIERVRSIDELEERREVEDAVFGQNS